MSTDIIFSPNFHPLYIREFVSSGRVLSLQARPRRCLIPNLVDELDHHVVLLDAEAIEVLPDCLGQLLLRLSSVFLSPRHRWRM